MGKETLIRMLVALLGEFLIKPETAAKYAKYLLRGRDYLLLLFPLDKYAEGDYSGTTIGEGKADRFAVPVKSVPAALRSGGRGSA